MMNFLYLLVMECGKDQLLKSECLSVRSFALHCVY
jgi:hypothetical protein